MHTLWLTAALLLSVAASVADEPRAPTADQAPPTPSDQQPERPEQCEDVHSGCKGWAASGECAQNPSFMHVQCRRACGLCSASAAGDAELDWRAWLLERWQALTVLLEGWRAGLTPPQQRLLSALTAMTVVFLSAVLWVWWQRREHVATTATATATAGLGSVDLSNVREQRLNAIGRAHGKPSAAREAPPPAGRPPVSPPAKRPLAFWQRFAGSGGGRGSGGGGGEGGSSGGGGGGSDGRGGGNGSVRDSWLVHEEAQQVAAAEAAAEAAAVGGGTAVAHWSSLLRGAEESEAALEAFAEGGRALLVAVEGSDPASLHLLRSVWPDAAVARRLQGEEAVLALRVLGSAPQAAFWRAELALTSLTELRLLSGAHGAEPLRARSLAAASLAHAMGRAAAEARRAGAASRARGAALLSRFRAWEARGFEPPPPPPPPPRPPSVRRPHRPG